MARLSELWKKGTHEPTENDIPEGGLAIDVLNKKVYSKGRDGRIFEVSGNPNQTFIGLADVPRVYGNSGQVLVVNEQRNGLEFGDVESTQVNVNLAGEGLVLNEMDNTLNVNLGVGLEFVGDAVSVQTTYARTDGNNIFEGNITATSFTGDGSQLTGIVGEARLIELQNEVNQQEIIVNAFIDLLTEALDRLNRLEQRVEQLEG